MMSTEPEPPGPDDYTTDDLILWLTKQLEYSSPAYTAAVELICDSRMWLERPDFRKVAVHLNGDGENRSAYLNLTAALRQAELHYVDREASAFGQTFGSGSYVILQVAELLASARLCLQQLDPGNTQLVVQAIAGACGMDLVAGMLKPSLGPRSGRKATLDPNDLRRSWGADPDVFDIATQLADAEAKSTEADAP